MVMVEYITPPDLPLMDPGTWVKLGLILGGNGWVGGGGVWLAWSGPTRVKVQILNVLFKFGLKHSCKSCK